MYPLPFSRKLIWLECILRKSVRHESSGLIPGHFCEASPIASLRCMLGKKVDKSSFFFSSPATMYNRSKISRCICSRKTGNWLGRAAAPLAALTAGLHEVKWWVTRAAGSHTDPIGILLHISVFGIKKKEKLLLLNRPLNCLNHLLTLIQRLSGHSKSSLGDAAIELQKLWYIYRWHNISA